MKINEQDPLLTEIKYLVTVATDSVSVAIASGQQFIMAIISDQIKQGITFPLSFASRVNTANLIHSSYENDILICFIIFYNRRD